MFFCQFHFVAVFPRKNRRMLFSRGMKRCVFVLCLAFCPALFAAQIETPFLRFTLISSNGACEIFDKEAQVSWHNDFAAPRFGWVRLNVHEQSHRVDLGSDIRIDYQPKGAR